MSDGWFTFRAKRKPPIAHHSSLFLGVFFPWRRYPAERRARLLGVALLAAVGQVADADPRRLVGLRVDQHDVGSVQRHFLRESAALRALAAPPPVPPHLVYAFDHQRAPC